jgi:hypothetical protein
MPEIMQYDELGSAQPDDNLVIVDVHDQDQSPDGTVKRITVANLGAGSSGGITPPAGDIGGTTSSPTVVSTHLAAALPVAQGGTGQTTQQAAMDALAGAQTSGDYLRGNGSHVAMAAIQAADLPAGTTSTQGALQLDGTAADIQAPGVQAAGAKGQAADAKHVHPFQPWQFLPESYGAKGDGKIIGDATISGGSLTTLTSASAAFTSGDTGKTIIVNGALGNNAVPLISLITYVNATTVTLTTTASSAVTNASAIYGTDDTSAVNSAVTAAKNYATGAFGNYHAQVLFGNKFYMLASGPTQTGDGSTTPTFNTQVPLPYPAVNGSTQKLVIDLIGTGPADDAMYWEAAIPNIQGSCLVSAVNAPVGGTSPFGLQSVVGGPSAAAGFTGSYANVKCYVDGLTVVIPFGTAQIGYDFRNIASAGAGRISAKAFGAPNGNYNNLSQANAQGAPQSNAGSVGVWPPLVNNNADATFLSVALEGFSQGWQLTEHNVVLRLASVYNTAAMQMSSAGNVHPNYFGYVNAEQGFSGLQSTGGSATSVIYIDCLDVEQQDMTWAIQDSGSGFQGHVNLVVTGTAAPAILNANKLEIRAVNPGGTAAAPGHWAGAPAVPASTTAQQNTAWLPAWVVVHTGSGVTVSVINVDGTNTGLTVAASSSQAVRVPAGKNITLTYSGGTPTWDWWLD